MQQQSTNPNSRAINIPEPSLILHPFSCKLSGFLSLHTIPTHLATTCWSSMAHRHNHHHLGDDAAAGRRHTPAGRGTANAPAAVPAADSRTTGYTTRPRHTAVGRMAAAAGAAERRNRLVRSAYRMAAAVGSASRTVRQVRQVRPEAAVDSSAALRSSADRLAAEGSLAYVMADDGQEGRHMTRAAAVDVEAGDRRSVDRKGYVAAGQHPAWSRMSCSAAGRMVYARCSARRMVCCSADVAAKTGTRPSLNPTPALTVDGTTQEAVGRCILLHPVQN